MIRVLQFILLLLATSPAFAGIPQFGRTLHESQAITARYLYDPYGRILAQRGTLADINKYRFSLQEYNASSGLVLYPSRTYDPVLQRWLTRDPMGELMGVNLYGFAANSPPNAIDPNGEFAHILIGTAAGFVVGGGVSIISDLYHGRDVDWNQAAISGTEGAIAGTVAAATFGASLPGSAWAIAGRGALSGLGGDLVAQEAGLYAGTRECFSASEAIISTGLGAGAPFLGKAVANVLGRMRGSLNAAKMPLTSTVGDLRAAGLKDAHHVIQDAAVRDLPGYNTQKAPGVQLPGPSTKVGTPHYDATRVQRQAGGGTYGAERRIGYKSLRRAGYLESDARQVISEADAYFESIGVTPSTPTRIPGNR